MYATIQPQLKMHAACTFGEYKYVYKSYANFAISIGNRMDLHAIKE